MKDNKIEWHRSRFADWNLVSSIFVSVFSVIVFVGIVFHPILVAVFFSSVLVLLMTITVLLWYDRTPVLVGVSEKGIILKHRFRFRGARNQEITWAEISRFVIRKAKGAAKILHTADGSRGLMIPEESADRIERLWKRGKGDLGTVAKERR
jgi:hypothetical protein